jgi:hypothetical protein
VATDGAGGPRVQVFRADGSTALDFFAYDPGFTGGVRVATGDVNGDGVADVVTATGPGAAPHVKVFDGSTGAVLRSFFAYDPGFTGGLYVAAGDFNGDGFADVVTGAGAGGGPHVQVFSGRDFTQLANFMVYDPSFTGGIALAVGDFTGDGIDDLATGAGPGGGPHVKVYRGGDYFQVANFFAYDLGLRDGIWVAAGDLNGDGRAELVTGAGPGGGPHVQIWNPLTAASQGGFFAYAPSFRGGVRVAVNDPDGDGRGRVTTGPGPGGGPNVRAFEGAANLQVVNFFAFDPDYRGGVFVA